MGALSDNDRPVQRDHRPRPSFQTTWRAGAQPNHPCLGFPPSPVPKPSAEPRGLAEIAAAGKQPRLPPAAARVVWNQRSFEHGETIAVPFWSGKGHHLAPANGPVRGTGALAFLNADAASGARPRRRPPTWHGCCGSGAYTPFPGPQAQAGPNLRSACSAVSEKSRLVRPCPAGPVVPARGGGRRGAAAFSPSPISPFLRWACLACTPKDARMLKGDAPSDPSGHPGWPRGTLWDEMGTASGLVIDQPSLTPRQPWPKGTIGASRRPGARARPPNLL